jgi:glycosyltransferase involved in cell wall biosynthesis
VHARETRLAAITGLASTSIVVITRDRPERLQACLPLLVSQGAAEVLVVDDGSRDAAAVAAVARSAGARLVRQAPAGVATARNTGSAHARGDLLLFTDDDCAPAPGWASALAVALTDSADVVAGPTLAARPQRALDRAWHLIADELAGWDGVGRGFLPGSNIGARASVLASVPFDARYDGLGAEDRDWWVRVHAAGLHVAYVPEAAVHHAPDLGLARFARKQARYGRGAYRFRATHHAGRTGPPGFYARLVREGARSGPRVASLVMLAQAAAAAGFAAERFSSARGKPARLSPGRRRRRRPGWSRRRAVR